MARLSGRFCSETRTHPRLCRLAARFTSGDAIYAQPVKCSAFHARPNLLVYWPCRENSNAHPSPSPFCAHCLRGSAMPALRAAGCGIACALPSGRRRIRRVPKATSKKWLRPVHFLRQHQRGCADKRTCCTPDCFAIHRDCSHSAKAFPFPRLSRLLSPGTTDLLLIPRNTAQLPDLSSGVAHWPLVFKGDFHASEM